MMNTIDQKEIMTEVRDRLRVRVGHHSVTLSSEDLEQVWNLLDDILSKYVDDQHLIGDPNG